MYILSWLNLILILISQNDSWTIQLSMGLIRLPIIKSRSSIRWSQSSVILLFILLGPFDSILQSLIFITIIVLVEFLQ